VIAVEPMTAGTLLEDPTEFLPYAVGEPGWDNCTAYVWKGQPFADPTESSWTRFLNSSDDPNATIVEEGIELIRNVESGDEITIDYRVWLHPKDRDYLIVFGGCAGA